MPSHLLSMLSTAPLTPLLRPLTESFMSRTPSPMSEMVLDIFHENIPNCNDVADTTCQYKEMEQSGGHLLRGGRYGHRFFGTEVAEETTEDYQFNGSPPSYL